MVIGQSILVIGNRVVGYYTMPMLCMPKVNHINFLCFRVMMCMISFTCYFVYVLENALVSLYIRSVEHDFQVAANNYFNNALLQAGNKVSELIAGRIDVCFRSSQLHTKYSQSFTQNCEQYIPFKKIYWYWLLFSLKAFISIWNKYQISIFAVALLMHVSYFIDLGYVQRDVEWLPVT